MSSDTPIHPGSAPDEEPVHVYDFQHVRCPVCTGVIHRRWSEDGSVTHERCERPVGEGRARRPCGAHLVICTDGDSAAVTVLSPDEARLLRDHQRRLQRLRAAALRRSISGA